MTIFRTAPVALGLFLAGTPALLALDAASVDTDGDGMVTIDEFAAAFPELGADDFTLTDSDADGLLNAAEIAAAVEAGLLPVMDG